MRNRWIKRHKIDIKASKNHIDETSSSDEMGFKKLVFIRIASKFV